MLQKPCTLGVSGDSISCSARIKSYPDGSTEILVCEKAIFREAGWEQAGKKPAVSRQKRENSPESQERSMRRARSQVRDLALCTPFRYFVTLTLDGAKIDRHDMAEITRKLNTWCDNQVRRKGLAYVLVPERHKDGAIHFHGFFNGALEARDSGTIIPPGGGRPRRPRSAAQRAAWLQEGGHVVYNLPGWTLGFTTAIELYGDYPRAVAYVCKYIGKDSEKIGGRWYYSGGDLGRPRVEYADADLREIAQAEGAFCFSIAEAGLAFALLRMKGGEGDALSLVGHMPEAASVPELPDLAGDRPEIYQKQEVIT